MPSVRDNGGVSATGCLRVRCSLPVIMMEDRGRYHRGCLVGDAPDAPDPEVSTVADAEAMVLSCLFRVDVTRQGRAYPRGVECWCHDRITSNQP